MIALGCAAVWWCDAGLGDLHTGVPFERWYRGRGVWLQACVRPFRALVSGLGRGGAAGCEAILPSHGEICTSFYGRKRGRFGRFEDESAFMRRRVGMACRGGGGDRDGGDGLGV